MKNANDLITVIIRSVGERTEQLSYELLKQQLNEENIFIVGEIPFVKTLEKAFKLALKENRKWTLCVDGDVLLKPGSIEKIVNFAEKQPKNIFLIQLLSLDKFLTFPREVGLRLYRTKVLKNAFQFLDDAKNSIRPESYTVRQIKKMGHDIKHSKLLMGLHDFEQYYEDIYRKCFVHSIKHLDSFNMEKIAKIWEERSSTDNDFKVAFAAYQNAQANRQDIYIDKNAPFMKEYSKVIKKLKLKEKDKIKINKNNPLKNYEKVISNVSKKDFSLKNIEDFKLEKKMTLKVKTQKRLIKILCIFVPVKSWRKRLRDIYKKKSCNVFLKMTFLINKGDIVFDCGANLAQETIPWARKGAEVYSFEPCPTCFKILKEKAKGFKNIHLYNKGVWDKNSKVKFYPGINKKNKELLWTQSSSILKFKKNVDNTKGVDIEVIDLVDFIEKLNKPIKLLKIDIEGAEVELLQKIIDTNLYKKIDHIVCETHEGKIPELNKPIKKIRKQIKKKKIKNIHLDWI